MMRAVAGSAVGVEVSRDFDFAFEGLRLLMRPGGLTSPAMSFSVMIFAPSASICLALLTKYSSVKIESGLLHVIRTLL